jgi:hypothetical protein
MLQSALLLAVVGLAPVAHQADSAHTLSADELALYTLSGRDVLLSLASSFSGQVTLALDPWIRSRPVPSNPERPWAGTRLSDKSLNTFTRASGILRICEPVVDGACRGNVRGTVLRLPAIRFHSADSAEVVLLTTTARSEFDNTVLVPQVRYYVYVVARQADRWVIRAAKRGLASWFDE